MVIHDLVIEVTRKCNIQCDHCLRGDAMNMDIKPEYIDTLLSQVTFIGNVVFSGGEPTLNLPIMEYFLSEVKRLRIEIGGFYIATNGVKITEDFIIFCLKMYSYCNEKEQCLVNVSNDIYHQYEDDYDTTLLSGLSFFRFKFDTDNFSYYGGSSLIKQGRSNRGREISTNYIETCDDLEEVTFYLNCEGEIINGCDWSYKNQKNYKICDVKDFTNFVESIKLKEHEESI